MLAICTAFIKVAAVTHIQRTNALDQHELTKLVHTISHRVARWHATDPGIQRMFRGCAGFTSGHCPVAYPLPPAGLEILHG